ncbi:hypothetical protein [Cronobacter phage JC01]|uniref:Uncharacterized protein n=1 Tax=Cronobacter phage JC01 TaxID=2729575 RepID=A0A6M3YKH1_9CAUD|nr:hypothetical protein JT331_gp43 [Cronobacter phage JC01]QJI52290.1 hypothetical protein [Cronobacter phage JC01]
MKNIPPRFSFEVKDGDVGAFAESIADAIREQHARKISNILIKVMRESRRLYPGASFNTVFEKNGAESKYSVVMNGSEVMGCLTVSLRHDELVYSLSCKKSFNLTAEDLK